jgi:hypothetical protein
MVVLPDFSQESITVFFCWSSGEGKVMLQR